MGNLMIPQKSSSFNRDESPNLFKKTLPGPAVRKGNEPLGLGTHFFDWRKCNPIDPYMGDEQFEQCVAKLVWLVMTLEDQEKSCQITL